MKKLFVLLALVTMITGSSVAYAQVTNTVKATVESLRGIVGCTATLGTAGHLITPTLGDRQKCNVTYQNNITAGYSLSYVDADTNTNLVQGMADSIVRLTPANPATYCGQTNGGTTAGNVANKTGASADCWSFTLGAKSDANATYPLDTAQGVTPTWLAFGTGEHAIIANDGTGLLTGPKVLNNAGTSASNVFNVDFWFEVQVDTTTQSGAYTNTTVVTIGDKA